MSEDGIISRKLRFSDLHSVSLKGELSSGAGRRISKVLKKQTSTMPWSSRITGTMLMRRRITQSPASCRDDRTQRRCSLLPSSQCFGPSQSTSRRLYFFAPSLVEGLVQIERAAMNLQHRDARQCRRHEPPESERSRMYLPAQFKSFKPYLLKIYLHRARNKDPTVLRRHEAPTFTCS